MDFGSINWLAVVVCVIFSFINGFVWYNPKVFYNIWWKAIGKTDADMEKMRAGNMGLTWGLTTLSAIVKAVSMAFMVNSIGAAMPGGVNALNGASVGLMLWLGFIAPTYLVNKLFAGQGFKVWAIETGNHLLDLVVFGIILGAWR